MFCAVPALAEDWARDVSGWSIGRSGDLCGMMNDYEGQGETRLALIIENDPGTTLIVVTNSEWSAEKGQPYRLRYVMGDKVHTVTSVGTEVNAFRKGFATVVGPAFLTDFAKATGLRISMDDLLVDSLNLGGSAAALNVFERCRSELTRDLDQRRRERERLSHIPLDPFGAPPGSLPVRTATPENQGRWAARIQENYPAEAVRNHIEGRVSVLVGISATGRVTDCNVSLSSGSTLLDDAACEGLMRYARYSPAIDSKGRPTKDAHSTTIVYELSH